MKYQIKLIDNYFLNYEIESCHSEFMKMLKVKKQGYESKHKQGYFPLDQDDFYGLHVFICDAVNDEIIVTFKVIPFSYTTQFKNAKFPLIDIVKESGNDIAVMNIQKFINKQNAKFLDFSYSGGWTMNPKYSGKGLSRELKDIYTGIHYHVHNTYNLAYITGIGNVELGTLEFFKKKWGLIEFINQDLSFDRCNEYQFRPIFQRLDLLSEEKLSLAEKYQNLWDERIELSQGLLEKPKIA